MPQMFLGWVADEVPGCVYVFPANEPNTTYRVATTYSRPCGADFFAVYPFY